MCSGQKRRNKEGRELMVSYTWLAKVGSPQIRKFADLKVPMCEIFHLFDFNDFYGIKSL
jgi:hypothetical protein